jgi:hypothetical protein
VSVGSGQWAVNGATVKLGGALATEVDAGSGTFTAGASGSRGSWTAHFGFTGDGPVNLTGTVTGPGPHIDATVTALGTPVELKGTPGKDFSVSFGQGAPGQSRFIDDARLAAAVQAPTAAAETPEQAASRRGLDWLRGLIAFTIVGALMLLVAPGLKVRARTANQSLPFTRFGIGTILALDIPLVSLVMIAVGLPFGLWWVGLLGLVVFLAIAVTGYTFAAYQLGRLALDNLGNGRLGWPAALPLGVGVLTAIGLIPYVGGIITLLAVLYGMGSMLYAPRTQLGPAEMTTQIAPVPQPAAQPVPAGRPVVD